MALWGYSVRCFEFFSCEQSNIGNLNSTAAMSANLAVRNWFLNIECNAPILEVLWHFVVSIQSFPTLLPIIAKD